MPTAPNGPTQPSIPPGVGKWVPASAGKAKVGMVHSVADERADTVQVKLWDPLRTRAIPERPVWGVFTTRRYTNPRLSLPYLTGDRGIANSKLVKLKKLSYII